MALPLPPGLVPAEVAFVCEMELVTVVPRQRLEPIDLLSGETPALRPPHRAHIPLWLALLLKKQRRANIVPPPWLHPASLQDIVNYETTIEPAAFSPPPPPPMRSDGRGGARPFGRTSGNTTTDHHHKPGDLLLSPPFLPSCTADAPYGHLPYHWLEVSETLLAHAADDIPSAAEVRTLLRDLQEVRAAKMRGSTAQLQAGDGVVPLRGVGAMELSEARGFVGGVVEGVRKLGASAEATRREEEEERARDGGGDDSEDEMDFQ
ncbi:DNA replication complex GINS protein PSF2 [Microdochium trichocladiopsis]|uniref:DNA replication complex GINS protein PSF2 n=1 Tax=Microdochium trichocladiopsis TaxID=1682393 RepID=A0A9P8Y993_9PEZI|nr:DNA replication complex GINS protein PSF2 [Microdochium trichocladiopsis]KAH7031296.1 DNA replication complex GINS protein PSF2 [Microdochium trichocladiopsis]